MMGCACKAVAASTYHAIECNSSIATTPRFVVRMLIIMASDACNRLRHYLLIENAWVMFGATSVVGSKIKTYAVKNSFYFTD